MNATIFTLRSFSEDDIPLYKDFTRKGGLVEVVSREGTGLFISKPKTLSLSNARQLYKMLLRDGWQKAN